MSICPYAKYDYTMWHDGKINKIFVVFSSCVLSFGTLRQKMASVYNIASENLNPKICKYTSYIGNERTYIDLYSNKCWLEILASSNFVSIDLVSFQVNVSFDEL